MLQGIRMWLEERYEIERICMGKSKQRTNFGGPTPGYATTYCDRRLNPVSTRYLCAKLCQPRHYLKLVQSTLRLAKKTITLMSNNTGIAHRKCRMFGVQLESSDSGGSF